MADNFDVKQFLFENKLGAYSKLKTEGEAAYEYEKGKAAGEKEEKEKLQKEGDDEDKLPLTPKMKKFIDKVINDAKKDGEFEELVQVDYFQNDLIDFILEKFDDEANYDDVSQEVKDYIKSAVGMKEDLDKDHTDAEAEKMMDFLPESEFAYHKIDGVCYKVDDEGNRTKVAAHYCWHNEAEKEVEEAVNMKSIQKAEMSLQNLLRNIATNSNIPTDEKEGLINALGELQDFVDEVGYDSERESELNENLSPEAYERMAGLSNIKAQQAMIKAAEIMMNELTAEGFEVDEVREFFHKLIANDI